MLRPLKDVLALLTTAGFTGGDALRIYRVFFGYLYGHILTELQEVVERPEETDDVLRLGLHRLAITEFPQVRRLAFAFCHSRRRRGTRPRPRPVAHWPHRHDVGSRRVTFVEVNERHILTHSKELLLGRSEPESARSSPRRGLDGPVSRHASPVTVLGPIMLAASIFGRSSWISTLSMSNCSVFIR